MILRVMIADLPGSSRRVHYLKLWGGFLIWICGTLAFFAIDFLVWLSIKGSRFDVKPHDWGYDGLPDESYYIWFGALLLLSLYQMLLYKWGKTFWSIFWRSILIIVQIMISVASYIFIYITYKSVAGYDLFFF